MKWVTERCSDSNCNKIATFNFKNEQLPAYCKEHIKENMVDVIHTKCLECDKIPCYNFENHPRGIYCKQHKKEHMIDILNKKKKCLECHTRASFNFGDKINGLYCKKHKKDNMVCVLTTKCIEPGCITQPCYNLKGQKIGIYCKQHKKENMVDVKNITCLDCDKRPHFNLEGNKKGIYCFDHKKDNMVDVSHKKCLTDFCQVRAIKKYENYCLFCFIHLFPDKPVAKNYKTKEKAVNDYIKEQFLDFTWISDRKIIDSCSNKRPDLLLDLGYQVIIIEIDENQHERYEQTCENKRIMELSRDLDHRPVVFIRFNPDDYLLDNKNVTSCWGPDGNGIMNIKKSKRKEWMERLETLKETVHFWINNKTEKTIELIYLFFDNA
jgi:hypothetical protein